MSATFYNALAFFTLHSLKNYDIGKKELSWSYTATFATIRRNQATTISSVYFFFGVSCHPKDISLFFVVYKVTQSSAFFSVIEHLFFSPLSIIVTVLWWNDLIHQLSLFLFKLLFSHAHFSCQLVWHCCLYLLMTWESSYLFISC